MSDLADVCPELRQALSGPWEAVFQIRGVTLEDVMRARNELYDDRKRKDMSDGVLLNSSHARHLAACWLETRYSWEMMFKRMPLPRLLSMDRVEFLYRKNARSPTKSTLWPWIDPRSKKDLLEVSDSE